MGHKVKIATFGRILDNQQRVLLCHRRDYDLWNLPGGRLESKELPWNCVIREVKEETGLDVKIRRLAGVYSKPEKDEIVFSFECEINGGNIILTDEADKIEYFEIENISNNTSPKQVERIKDLLYEPDKTVLKIQKGKSSIELIKEGKL